jgi:hypothetical protein
MRRNIKTILALAAAAAAAVWLGPALAAMPSASAAAELTAEFTLTWNWGSGYEAGYTITNNSSAAISGWTVVFDLPAPQQMGNYWNALETVSGSQVTFTNRNYNGTVAADGGTTSFGFIVTGPYSPPTNCTINGSPCAGSSGTPGAASPSPSPSAPSPMRSLSSLRRSPTPSTPSASPAPSAAPSPGTSAGSFAVAPYVDMTNSQEGMLDQAARAGLKAFSAAFVTGSGCTPIWGDTLPVSNDPTVTGEITRAESEGATPIVAFGGEAGIELAQSWDRGYGHQQPAFRGHQRAGGGQPGASGLAHDPGAAERPRQQRPGIPTARARRWRPRQRGQRHGDGLRFVL